MHVMGQSHPLPPPPPPARTNARTLGVCARGWECVLWDAVSRLPDDSHKIIKIKS